MPLLGMAAPPHVPASDRARVSQRGLRRMRQRFTVSPRFALLSLSSVLLVACSGAGTRPHPVAASGRNATRSMPAGRAASTLSLRSALVVDAVPEPAPGATTTVSCRGGALCRETIAPAAATDMIEEAKEDCEHRGGRTGGDACPRERVVASCTLTGGAGPIRVFTYAQSDASEQAEAISTMDDLCGAADGIFERR